MSSPACTLRRMTPAALEYGDGAMGICRECAAPPPDGPSVSHVTNEYTHLSERPRCGMIDQYSNSYEASMRISERGQLTIPKELRDRFGMNKDVEVEITPTEHGLLIQKRTAAKHPVERVSGILDGLVDVDQYIEEIRGR